ncbi:hypothetical protein KAW18_13075, partial [candidate division WOR-3 bacterium]|nr:hypothetical protein [candidate division WOR-3 bacterium]
ARWLHSMTSSLFLFLVEVWEEPNITHQFFVFVFIFDSRLMTDDAGLLISYLSTTERKTRLRNLW